MARLSYEERIKRLEEQRNQLIKPTFVIAETVENGVNTVTIFSNGKKEARFFPDNKDFLKYIDTVENCNIIADSKLIEFRDVELQEAVSNATTEDLKAIVDGKCTAQIVQRTLYKTIISKIG